MGIPIKDKHLYSHVPCGQASFGGYFPVFLGDSDSGGAALTDKEICEIRDNTGGHISHKNRQYCELTALYGSGKNR